MSHSGYADQTMMNLALDQISHRYGDRILFDNVSLQLKDGDHYAIVGANGAGKSTLLRLISGDEMPYNGSVSRPSKMHIGVLKQDHFAYENIEIINVVMMGRERFYELHSRREELLSKESISDSEGFEMAEIEEEYANLDGYSAEGEATRILVGLGIEQARHNEPLKVLSGGFKLRVLLARLLFEQPDLLLLDEPTNHLDLDSIVWLEQYLQEFQGTILLVSHDHEFLDKVSKFYLDIDYQDIRVYRGPYHKFISQKLQDIEILDKTRVNQDKRREELSRFIERFGAKASKATQAQSKRKQLQKLEEIEIPQTSRRAPHFQFDVCRQSGVTPLVVSGIAKSFDEKRVLGNVSFEVGRGEKVAILGPNGVGKSTLLKIIMDQLVCEKGEVEWGYESHPAYFPQDHHDILNEKQTLADWIMDQEPSLGISGSRKLLGLVLFSGEEADKKISALSGGECGRLVLARIMKQKQNILIMDEPTNHLDLETVEALAQALQEYEGTLIVVSHNRFLVRAVADRLILIKPDGIEEFMGGYEEYLQKGKEDYLKANRKSVSNKQVSKAKSGLSYEEQKRIKSELKKVSRLVSELESKHQELEKLNDENMALIFDYEKFSELSKDQQKDIMQKKHILQKQLGEALQQWEAKAIELEALEAQASDL